MHKTPLLFVLAVLLLAGCGEREVAPVVDAEAFAAAHADWRADRAERLQRPDGWLALVSRDWLVGGEHAFGSDESARYRFSPGPAIAGRLRLHEGTVTLLPEPAAQLQFQGAPVRGPMDLTPPRTGASPRVEFDGGRGRFEVIGRGDRFALRVMHDQSPTRTAFEGLQYFDPDPDWAVRARFHAHPEGRTIPIVNVLGDEEAMANPGRLAFEVDGRTHTLEALEGGDGRLFVIYADRSNGRDTYAAGRFLYTDPPVDGSVVVDFNRGYNPPCAFSAYTTCPLPPPENRLDLTIRAGELRYTGPDPSAAYHLPDGD